MAGREVAGAAAARGAHAVVADRDEDGAARIVKELASITSPELTGQAGVDIRSRESIRKVLGEAALAFGGIDILINTAAIYPSSSDGDIPDSMWATTMELNVTANYLLADEATKLFEEQGLHGNIVFTSSANAVAAKRGSEAYDVSKAALSHPHSRAGGEHGAQRARERNQSCHPGERIVHVSPRPGARLAEEVQYSFPGIVQR